MVWAIAVTCVSLSCEPLPIMMGWFFSQSDCVHAAYMINESWKPEIGLYRIECIARSAI